MPRRLAPVLTLVIVLASLASGCTRAPGPPPIASGASCAACGMTIADLAFACERQVDRKWRAYDSIECLLREGTRDAYLADYDTRTLHDADSMWVVHGDFPSPMGGGYAGFLDRSAADAVAMQTAGRVARLEEFADAAAAEGGHGGAR